MIIVPEMIGCILGIYSGKIFNGVELKPEMFGNYTGEFRYALQMHLFIKSILITR